MPFPWYTFNGHLHVLLTSHSTVQLTCKKTPPLSFHSRLLGPHYNSQFWNWKHVFRSVFVFTRPARSVSVTTCSCHISSDYQSPFHNLWDRSHTENTLKSAIKKTKNIELNSFLHTSQRPTGDEGIVLLNNLTLALASGEFIFTHRPLGEVPELVWTFWRKDKSVPPP